MKHKSPYLRRTQGLAEKITGISLTEPLQVQPLEKLLAHRQQGAPVPYFNGVFTDRDTPDIFKMDAGEILLLREETAEGIRQAQEDLHAINKAYETLMEDQVKARTEAELKRREDALKEGA